jgi:cyanophycinase-like exopeptidase
MMVAVARLLMLIGSGETSPTMVTAHQQVFARLGAHARGVQLDSPYGFQENADELTDRGRQYFAESVGHDIEAITFRSAPPQDAAAHATEMARLRAADWIFAGPGSPSYALRTWAGSAVPAALDARLRDGGAVVFASAAALTLGLVTVPVYEIYKVGEAPRWLDGLDVFGRATGLRAAIVPHWNNAEGGTHDTRFCYLGESRLRILEAELPDDTFVLGFDEHTGLIIDLDTGIADVVGRGCLTVRVDGREWSVQSGQRTSLEEIAAHGQVGQHRTVVRAVAATTGNTQVEVALKGGDIAGALSMVAELDRQATDEAQRAVVQSLLARCIAELHAPVDMTMTVTPYIDLLLDLRRRARDEKRWDDSDAIRDGLKAAGVEVHDGPNGVSWVLAR